jgi:tRNA A-37 threonylcarbamoyl transferase component Bud32
MKQALEGERTTATAHGPMRAPAPDPAELAKHFPELEILEFIGQGGMGYVYKARQVKLDRLVALKILASELAKGVEFTERFTREARTLARVSHPHIVGIHDFGESGGFHYFVMEYVDGANLRDILRAGKLTPREALAIVPQICDAIQYAHDEGFVHRDIKPENILVDRKGRVKIADFGLAKLLQIEGKPYTLTLSGQVMGTPAYMAPEQIERPADVDHRADIYSLGVILYEMLTGELPLGHFAPPSRKVQLDVRLDEVVLHALAKEPERRYQHASDVKDDVESIGRAPTGEGHSAVEEPPPPPRAGPSLRSREGTTVSAGTVGAAASGSRTLSLRRPAAVVWIAVYFFLAIEFGAPVLVFTPLSTSTIPAGIAFFSLTGPLRAQLLQWYSAGLISLLLVGLVVWSIVVGIGLLRLREWARRQAVVLCFLGLAYFALVLFGLGVVGTRAMTLGGARWNPNWISISEFTVTGIAGIATILPSILYAILTILVLAYLRREDVATLFRVGLGPVTVSGSEAERLERFMASRNV